MQLLHKQNPHGRGNLFRMYSGRHWVRMLACLTLAAALTGAGRSSRASGQSGQARDPDRPYLIPEANRLPNVNDQMVMREQKSGKQNFDAANAERKKQMENESAQLITLAMALKAEVDNTGSNPLSANAIRKAEEIQALAHNVKQLMSVTVGAN